MKPFITETESATVIVIPKGEANGPSDLPVHATFCWLGTVIPLPDKVVKAAAMWRDGRTAAEMSDALKLSHHPHDTDAGQRLLGAIRMVLPELLPPRITPRRKKTGGFR